MRTTGIFKTAVAATALACTLAACGGTTESGGDGTGAVNPNGEFVIASITVPSGFDPHKELHGGERPFWFLVFDRLTQMKKQGEIEPMLATEGRAAAEGQAVNFQARDAVTFNAGRTYKQRVGTEGES